MYSSLISVAVQSMYLLCICGGLKTTNLITNFLNNLNMRKMTEYIVAGVKADNEKVFLARVSELLEKTNLLEFLTEGVPALVQVSDAEALLKSINSLGTGSCLAVEVLSAEISPEFNIQVRYKYICERYWFKSEEDKDSWEKDSWAYNQKNGEKSKDQTDEFAIEGIKYSTTNVCVPKDIEGLYVAYI